MKFEKFLKSVGTHGQIYKRDNGDKWLICAGVGMKIPVGVDNLLGVGEVSEKVKTIVDALIGADLDDRVQLERACIEKDGKASDIIRVFGDALYDDEIGISNANFGLLEKRDINLVFVEIEDEDTNVENRYLLVLDEKDEAIGFISDVNNK